MPIGLTTLLPFPFPWSVVPTEPPDLPCFTSLRRVHAEEGKCLRRWPGASKRPSQAGGEVPLPNGGWWALGWPLAGSFPRRGHITTFLLQVPALSPPFGERNTNPLPSPSCLCCADGGCGGCVGARGSRILHTGGAGDFCINVQEDSIQSIACSMHDHPQQWSLWCSNHKSNFKALHHQQTCLSSRSRYSSRSLNTLSGVITNELQSSVRNRQTTVIIPRVPPSLNQGLCNNNMPK